jgi:uncharacterized protein (DUF1697 family)
MMATWICLLRAVNVGGRNKVPMAQLREALTAAGLGDVRTYVQSGNVVLTSSIRSRDKISATVRDVIAQAFDVDTPVVVRTPEELQTIVEWNPFPDVANADPKRVHIVHLTGEPTTDAVASLLTIDWAPDHIKVEGSEVAICYSESMHTSKLQYPKVFKQLGVDGTARNWRTIQTLVDMSTN